MRNLIIALTVALVVAACGGDAGGSSTTVTVPPGSGDPVAGEAIFSVTCMTCHGPGGVGVEGLGKPLTASTFVSGLTDTELLAFLAAGRAADDPLNTTGLIMPARGGNPALTDADLIDVVAFLRTLAG